MDDLIVIILTLVVAGFGVLGQMRKKKQGLTAETETPQEDIWDLFQTPPGKEEIMETPKFTEQPAAKIVDFAPKPAYSFNPKDEGVFAFNAKNASKPLEGITHPKNKEVFSLRNAVIYSEILNRKYE